MRVVYLLTIAPAGDGVAPDSLFFRGVARALAEGHGFAHITPEYTLEPTAAHPPGYPFVLAGLAGVGVDGDGAFRATSVVFGTLTVVGIGLLGRRAGGEGAGIAAALIAALYPTLIAADGALMSESLFGLCVVLAMLAAYRLIDRPSPFAAALLGLAIGVATLVRAEALVLLVLLALPLAWRAGSGRAMRLAAVIAAFAVVLAPWLVRNWSVFDRPVLSTNLGYVLASTNCRDAYHGRNIGWLGKDCALPQPVDEAEESDRWLEQAADYAGEHPARATLVAGVRALRIAGLYQPFRAAHEQERNVNLQRLGILLFYPLAALALAGAVILRRRRRPLTALAAPVAMALITAAATWGSVRIRHGAEPALVVLAGVATASLGSRAWRQRRQSRPVG